MPRTPTPLDMRRGPRSWRGRGRAGATAIAAAAAAPGAPARGGLRARGQHADDARQRARAVHDEGAAARRHLGWIGVRGRLVRRRRVNWRGRRISGDLGVVLCALTLLPILVLIFFLLFVVVVVVVGNTTGIDKKFSGRSPGKGPRESCESEGESDGTGEDDEKDERKRRKTG